LQAIFTIVTLLSLSAFAGPFSNVKKDQPVCYERDYSSEHMLKNSKQTVKSMKVKIYKDKEDSDSEMLYLAIEADVKPKGKNDYKHYRSGMACTQEDGKLKCWIDCDGGNATLRPSLETPETWLRFENQGFTLYGGCGEEIDEEDTIYLEPTKGGDDLFLLKKIEDPKACAAIKVL
jgi:hypothetical protein